MKSPDGMDDFTGYDADKATDRAGDEADRQSRGRSPIKPIACPGGALPCDGPSLGCGACYIHCLCNGEEHFRR